MAVIFLEPSGSGFAGGVAGGYPRANSTDRSQTAWAYPVGTTAKDVLGNQYMVIKAGAAIALNDIVRTNADLSDVRKTSYPAQQVIGGAAGTAFASGDYGWILTKGSTTVLCDAAVVANDLLGAGYTAGTAGRVSGSLFAPSRCVAITSASTGTCTARFF